MKIIIDAMSGDNAPQEIVAGAVKAADELGVEIVFVGRDKDVRACLGSRADQFEIVNAEDIITSAKNNASMIVNDALIKAYELNSKNETLERNYKIFKKKLEVLTTEYKTVLDELNSLDYKD